MSYIRWANSIKGVPLTFIRFQFSDGFSAETDCVCVFEKIYLTLNLLIGLVTILCT